MADTLTDLMNNNERLCKELYLAKELLSLYKKALIELQAHPTAKKALESARFLETKKR